MISIPHPIQRALFTSLPTPADFVVTEGTGTCAYASDSFIYTPSFNGLRITKTAHNTSNLTFNFGLKTQISQEFGTIFFILKATMPEVPANSLELVISENGSPIITSPFTLNGGTSEWKTIIKDFSASNLNSYNFAIRLLQGATALTTTTLTIDEIQAYYSYNNIFDFDYKKGGNPTMWVQRFDGTNTPTLTASTNNIQQVQLNETGNGYGVDFASLLNVNGKVTPINVGDVLNVNFSYTVETPSGTDRFVETIALVNSVLYCAETHILLKGSGNDDFVTVSWSIPITQTIKTNGIEIALKPNANCVVKNRRITVTRTHEAL